MKARQSSSHLYACGVWLVAIHPSIHLSMCMECGVFYPLNCGWCRFSRVYLIILRLREWKQNKTHQNQYNKYFEKKESIHQMKAKSRTSAAGYMTQPRSFPPFLLLLPFIHFLRLRFGTVLSLAAILSRVFPIG